MNETLESVHRDTMVTALLLVFTVLFLPAPGDLTGVGVLLLSMALAGRALLALITGQARLTRQLEAVRRDLGAPISVSLHPYTLVEQRSETKEHAARLRDGLDHARTGAASAVRHAALAGAVCLCWTLVGG